MQRTDRKFPGKPTFQTPSPQLSTHSPKLTGPRRGAPGHVGMPAGSQLMANGLSTLASGRIGREKAAAPTGCLSAGLGRQRRTAWFRSSFRTDGAKAFGFQLHPLASPPALRLTRLSALYIHVQCTECRVRVDKPLPCSPDEYLLSTYCVHQCELETPATMGLSFVCDTPTHRHIHKHTFMHTDTHSCTHNHAHTYTHAFTN